MTGIVKLIYVWNCVLACSWAAQDTPEESLLELEKMNYTNGEVVEKLLNSNLSIYSSEIDQHIQKNISEETSEANKTDTVLPKVFSCIRSTNHSLASAVKLANGSELIEILVPDKEVRKTSPSHCVVVLFYIKTCPFSTSAAPHFNALARAFPDVTFLAVDAVENHSYNMMFGVISVPNVIFFHNGKLSERYNETDFTLTSFSLFLMRVTDLVPAVLLNVTSADFYGPVPSTVVQERDIWLWVSWIFIMFCFMHFISKTTMWKKVVDNIYATWCEAEAQHEHVD